MTVFGFAARYVGIPVGAGLIAVAVCDGAYTAVNKIFPSDDCIRTVEDLNGLKEKYQYTEKGRIQVTDLPMRFDRNISRFISATTAECK